MTFLIDGTFNGLCTAVFNAYLTKKFPSSVICGNAQLSIDSDLVEIQTDDEKAIRVTKKLKKILNGEEFQNIKIALKSCDEAKFTVTFNYIVKTINAGFSISENFTDKTVFNFDKIVSRVLQEVHRFKGFIRFSQTEEGIFYAKYFPDNDINTLILPHFVNRYKDMPFMIHDLNHNVISAHANGKTKTVLAKINPLKISDEASKLFKDYYNAISIKERANTKTMLNFMPKRYHSNLPEKDELL